MVLGLAALPALANFLGGGLAEVVRVSARSLKGEDQSSALAIFGGVSMDLFSDGVMIGTGTVLNPALGLLLPLGQMPADLPEGFAAVATLRRAGIREGAVS